MSYTGFVSKLESCLFFIGLLVGIIVIFALVISLLPISNPSMTFEGTSKSYTLSGQYCTVIFNADSLVLRLQNDDILLRSVKNISIENWDGETILKNGSYIQINYKENLMDKYPINFQNIDVNVYFENVTIIRTDDRTYVEGYTSHNRMFSSGDSGITIPSSKQIKSINVGGEEFTDFKNVNFNLDDTSNIDLLHAEKIIIEGWKTSEFRFSSQILEHIRLDKTEGILKLDNLPYEIKNDKINVEINSDFQNSLNINNFKMYLSATVNSADLNDKTIIKPKIFYSYDQEPEKINALAALFLAAVTCIYVSITMKTLRQTEKIIEQTKIEKKLDNIDKMLMNVYSPMEYILTKFNSSLEYYKSMQSDGIPIEFNNLFKEMNDKLLEIKRNYGYLFDSELIEYHDSLWKLWEQYLCSEQENKKDIYDSLSAEIKKFHNVIGNKIDFAKHQKDNFNNDFNN